MNKSNNNIMPPIDASNNYINFLLPEDLSHNVFYPLNLTGQLCPLLNNNDLLYGFYDKSEHRADIIKFYKDHRWDTKAKYQAPFTGPELKRVLPSLLNSAHGRSLLCSDSKLELYHIIWIWLRQTNRILYDDIIKYCINDADERIFLKPEGLALFLNSNPIEKDIRNQIAYTVLAFSMLEPNFRLELISIFLKKFPDYSHSLGISESPIPQVEHTVTRVPLSIDHSDGNCNSNIPDIKICNEPPRTGPSCCSDINTLTDIPSSMGSKINIDNSGADINISNELTRTEPSCYINIINDINQNFQVTSKSFINKANAISRVDSLCEFNDSGAVKEQLTNLDSLRIKIFQDSSAIQQAFARSCLNNNDKCILNRFAHERNISTISKISNLVDALDEISCHAEILNKIIKEKKSKYNNSTEKCSILNHNLGIKDADEIILPEETTPCILLDLFEKQDIMEENLVQKEKDKLAEEKQKIIERLEKLREHYNLAGDSLLIKQLESYNKLSSRIMAAADFNDIPEINNNIEDLEFECLEIDSHDYRKLAAGCFSNTDISRFLDLCDSLLVASKPDIAYILLHTSQMRFPPAENIVFCERFIKTLMDVCCKLSSFGINFEVMWKDVFQSEWLLSLKHGDIENPEILEQLTLFLTAAALSNNDIANLFLSNIRAIDICNQYLHNPLFTAIIQSVIEHRKCKFISTVEKECLSSLADDVHECIRKDGNKYRHIQSKDNGDFIDFENYFVFPALEKFWNRIRSDVDNNSYDKALQDIDGVIAEELYDESKRANNYRRLKDHPIFTSKIKKYITEFINKIKTYVIKSEELSGCDDFVIIKDELISNLRDWSQENDRRSGIFDIFNRQISLCSDSTSDNLDFMDTISQSKNIILGCPNFVVWLCTQCAPILTEEAYEIILRDLTIDTSYEEVARILEDGEAWLHRGMLSSFTHILDEENWEAKSKSVIENINAKVTIELKDEVQSLIASGHYLAVQAIAEECKHENDNRKGKAQEEIYAFVNNKIHILNNLKNQAESANMPPEWIDKIFECANKIDIQLRHLKRVEHVSGDKDRLNSAINTLEFIIKERVRTFSELEMLLNPPVNDTDCCSILSDQMSLAIQKSPELFRYWDKLSQETKCGKAETARAWTEFVKAFALKCDLYRDDNRTLTTLPQIKYPFSVYKTAFRRPKSVFLSRDVRFYLYRQNDIDQHDFRLLEDELSEISYLHIIFAPQGYERIKHHLKYEKETFKNFLLVNKEFLARVMIADKPDVPLRQDLHASVTDLASSSPFVSQGYCHQNNNIYVGRTEILKKLLNNPQSTIWGGRRLGKTSVLHALENTLGKTYDVVAYVYADIPEDGDPDINLAKKLAERLNFGEVNSIDELEKALSASIASGKRIAILLDEVDEYIKKSREKHADAFPLATILRKIIMSDSKKETILVYSGYHQLYFETELDQSKKRVGHPFKNVTQNIDIGVLTAGEVGELVRIGFKEMLNISIDPAVSREIYKKASGHPAFVQRFCQCLLERVSKRRSPSNKNITITEDDVNAVYRASAMQDGCEPFILYVNETLDLNLSHLGRAIMLVICDLYETSNNFSPNDDYFLLEVIQNHLKEWCDVLSDVEMPEKIHIKQTIELLKMTNMLTQSQEDVNLYKVSYSTYIDILRRLDKLGRQEIVASLKKYDKEERNKGVLL